MVGKARRMNWELTIPIIIFLVAFFSRFLFIGRYFGQDEVYYVGYSKDLISGRPFSSVFPPFFYLFLLPVVALFGDNEIIIHILMAFLGAMNVLVVYYFGKRFLNETAGIVASILLAFNTTHFFFSDFAMLDMPVTLFATVGFYFFWSWYKGRNERDLILGSLFTTFATMTKYAFFGSVAMLGYLFFYDRKVLKDRKALFFISLPLIFLAVWMGYYVSSLSWLWKWWFSYLTGQLSINLPFYIYLESIYSEFLLPILTFFVIFAVLFLEAEKRKIHSKASYVFLTLFILIYLFVSPLYLQPTTKAVIGFFSVFILGLYYYQKKDIYKFLVFIVLIVFLFYSPIKVKFPRYVLPALPALYLLIGQMFSDLRRFKWFFVIGILALAWFVISNFEDTANKLIVDKEINRIKFQTQDYINKNSPECSPVYSSTWYGFYYLRTRITDLPSSVDNLKSAIQSRCTCPPRYVVSEGSLSSNVNSVLILEKEFSGSAIQYKYLETGKTDVNNIAPVQVYKINEEFIKGIC